MSRLWSAFGQQTPRWEFRQASSFLGREGANRLHTAPAGPHLHQRLRFGFGQRAGFQDCPWAAQSSMRGATDHVVCHPSLYVLLSMAHRVSWVAAKAIQSPRPCTETNSFHPTDTPPGVWTPGQPKSAQGDPAIESRSDIRSMGCHPGRGTAAQAYDGNRDGIPHSAGCLKWKPTRDTRRTTCLTEQADARCRAPTPHLGVPRTNAGGRSS